MAIDQLTIAKWATESGEAFRKGYIDGANAVEYSPFNACAYTAGYREALMVFYHPDDRHRADLVAQFPTLG